MFNNNLLMGAAAATSGTSLVSVGNSALFDQVASDNLSLTTSGSPTGPRIQTFDFWVYRCGIGKGDIQTVWSQTNSNAATNFIAFDTNDNLRIDFDNVAGSATLIRHITTRVFRDTAWYHIHFVVDSNQTNNSCVTLTVNGVVETAFGTQTNPSSAQDLGITTASGEFIGRYPTSDINHGDHYIANFVRVDGLAKWLRSMFQLIRRGLLRS